MTDRPECEEQRAYLVRMFFGSKDETNGFISRAYRDMSRTLHGLSKLKNKEALKANATKALLKSLRELNIHGVPPVSNDLPVEFDAWHRRACSNIVSSFAPFHCHYGQAQKWLNMVMKYRWFFAAEDEFREWHSVAHVPVDDFVLRAATRLNIPHSVKKAWSRWERREYQAFQDEIRIFAAEQRKAPLAVEHGWWMEQSVRQRASLG